MFKLFVIFCLAMASIDALPATSKQQVYPQLRQVLPVKYPLPKFTALSPYPSVSKVVLNRQLEVLYKSFADKISMELLFEKIGEHLDLEAVHKAIGNITVKELFTAFRPVIDGITFVWHHIEHYWKILSQKPAPPLPPSPPMEANCEDGEEEHAGENHEEEGHEHMEEHNEEINHHEQDSHHNAHKDHKEQQPDKKHPVHPAHPLRMLSARHQ